MIEWSWADAIPAAYLRLSFFIVALLAIYYLGPKIWRLMVRFKTRNFPSKSERGKEEAEQHGESGEWREDENAEMHERIKQHLRETNPRVRY